MSKHLNLIIDDEQVAALAFYQQEHSLTQSQAVRNLLNIALKTAAGPDAGWREGRNEARALALQVVSIVFAELPEDMPTKVVLEQLKLRMKQITKKGK